jgi:hypothetical protein
MPNANGRLYISKWLLFSALCAMTKSQNAHHHHHGPSHATHGSSHSSHSTGLGHKQSTSSSSHLPTMSLGHKHSTSSSSHLPTMSLGHQHSTSSSIGHHLPHSTSSSSGHHLPHMPHSSLGGAHSTDSHSTHAMSHTHFGHKHSDSSDSHHAAQPHPWHHHTYGDGKRGDVWEGDAPGRSQWCGPWCCTVFVGLLGVACVVVIAVGCFLLISDNKQITTAGVCIGMGLLGLLLVRWLWKRVQESRVD